MLHIAEQFQRTDIGRKREVNEDAFLADPPLFVVADGMGGARAGEVASRLAVEAFAEPLPAGNGIEQRLAQRVLEANSRIHTLSLKDSSRSGMGTTLTAAYLDDSDLTLAHVGDSRAYLLRDGELKRLTDDHSLVEELVRSGRITPEQASDHPQRSVITRALGPEPDVAVDTVTYRALPGDVFMLCSDGLTGMVEESSITGVLLSQSSLRQAGNRLIQLANEAGGRDNITVVLFSVAEGPSGDGGLSASIEGSRAGEADMPAGSLPEAEDSSSLADRKPTVASVEYRKNPTPARRKPLWRRTVRGFVIALVVLTPVAAGVRLAVGAVYFLGTDSGGTVTLYRGLPYTLPGDLRLYSKFYVSGVRASELTPVRRRKLLDHRLRSLPDARDLVRKLERGQIEE